MGRRLFLFLILSSGLFSIAFAAEDPQALVTRADQVRFPSGSYQFDAVVTTFDGETKKTENGYRGFIKDLDRTLVEFVSPASEKGKSLLTLGEDLWMYLPNLKKPVRISFQQRLVGDVSNGDMARSNLSHDYDAALAGGEKIGGQDCYVLDLVAKSPSKTYNKIKYWVSKDKFWPVQAEFFTVSGKSLKMGLYEDFRMVAGAMRPMRLVFTDSINRNKKSILQFNDMARKRFDDSMFTKEYMKTLE